ncbi:MAG: class II fructose-bisphosphate aldolase, partial [Rickettsiales bacterium]|nr:class II fructose-bisphosphate aldolase [Rickettsiales bacterium]
MKSPLIQALSRDFAVPAFNFYNLESFHAIAAAARATRKDVIFAASESAIKYMG